MSIKPQSIRRAHRSTRPLPSRLALVLFLAGFLATLPAAAQESGLLAFGDSITHGFGDGNVQCGGSSGGYPPRLSTRLQSRGRSNNMRTRGVCGELTSQGVSRMPGVLASNSDRDVIIIMEGTNDLSNNNISTESMRFNINSMAQMVLDAGMRPVIAAPIPRSPEAAGSNARAGFLSSLIRQDADAADIDFAETYDDLINISNLYDRFYADPYHPNSSGYGLLVNSLEAPTLAAVDRTIEPEPCVEDDETLCLQGSRFEISVAWEDFEGKTGTGQAVTLTSDTGYFWFFEDANVELVVKVLDGREINNSYWVFFGALSDVSYTMVVRDSESGVTKVYDNPPRNLASRGDTEAFPIGINGSPNPQPIELLPVEAGTLLASDSLGSRFDELKHMGVMAIPAPGNRIDAELGPGKGVPGKDTQGKDTQGKDTPEKMACATAGATLCLNGDRFSIGVEWEDRDGNTGTGLAKDITDDTGYFYFFEPNNVELVVKVLDARPINGFYWLFYGSLSDVRFELQATDTESGSTVRYQNPLDNFGSRADVEAFQ